MNNVQILTGDCLAQLRTLAAESVHCCITSPPYFGLRDYGVDGQIGLEETPSAFVAKMVEVFREVWRVLRPDGTVWLNLGDSYANDTKWGGQTSGKHAGRLHGDTGIGRRRTDTGLKSKDLIGIPWRVAFALQDDGWWLRSDVVWHKPNPMPESVTDRPTRAHEYIFLLTKAERYFYDAEAIREPAKEWSGRAATFARDGAVSEHILPGQTAAQHRPDRKDKQRGHGRRHDRFNDRWDGMSKEEQGALGRNKRDVWTVATKPYSAAHFATFPPDLIEPCILAGTSAAGCCPACGAPWARLTEKTFHPQPDVKDLSRLIKGGRNGLDASNGWGETPRGTNSYVTTGWEPTCTCVAGVAIPCTVLDPFAGSGTTLAVALKHNRAAIGIELNPDYVNLIHQRIEQTQPMLLMETTR